MSNENQHWVPRFLIKNFADTDGRVFRLDVQTDEIKKPPPKYPASDKAFNDFVINGKTVSFEDKLEKIETAAAPVLRQIVQRGSVAGLTEIQRGRLSDFMAAQSFRTDAFYKGLELQGSRQEFGPIFAQLWRSAFFVSAEIMRRRWVLCTIKHDDVFHLGDHPLVLQYSEKDERDDEVGFDIEGVEALMPITPKQALYMPCAATSEQIISGYQTAQQTPKNIQAAKARGVRKPKEMRALRALSQRILRQQRSLYEALTAGKPLIALPENVENLNYLQCAWAHAAVYSNRSDFTFAKHVFSKTPQYRETLRARLAQVGDSR